VEGMPKTREKIKIGYQKSQKEIHELALATVKEI
jgi:hypothetical protein